MNLINGVLVVDKPQDWTSHDVCAFVKGRFRVKKVGHAGTLDPMATGLLVLLLGSATKQSMALSGCDKEYDGVMELGVQTTSHDKQGEVIATAPWESITLSMIKAEVEKSFTGEIEQVPPMVSAVKHKGVRLYKLARKGVTVEREPRKAIVHEFHVKKKEGPLVDISVSVSKGTYVRTLVNDLGEALGCHATLAGLRRVRSGEFNLDDSITIEELKKLTPESLRTKVMPLEAPTSYAHHHEL